ncbi:subtilisin-like protein [Lactarius akahatsu]|uniref:Subtilisin-like protein n=1 Tax=Lactarius akahatsu TaxID=416441 RepID=A0AAD4QF81_9AGAM|nr:subtilisin-like protein [Lactarius akahatsu]
MRYQLLSVFFAVAAVPLGCFATLPAPRWDNMRVKHAWEAVPENWESLGIPSVGTTINLHLALKPRREEVSSPGHSKHEQVAELVIPHPHTLELVKSWLKYHSVPSPTSLTHGGNWLTLTGVSVSKANDLPGPSYQLYRHAETKEVIIRTVGYSLPAALHGHVQTVAPTTYFASLRMSWQTPRMRPGGAAAGQVNGNIRRSRDWRCWAAMTTVPHRRSCTGLYNSATYVPAAMDRNVLEIAGFSQEYPNPEDLTTFMDHFHGPETGATYIIVQVNGGGYDPNNPGIEASVDVQYTSGMALISSSYANYEIAFPQDHARTVCDLFMQLGARGDCMTDGNVRFRPTFPASCTCDVFSACKQYTSACKVAHHTCPWVTGVRRNHGYPETAAGLSGGGFSEYLERPNYQDDAVALFFEILGNQYHGLYNASGPDIAAQSYDIAIMLGGEYYEALDGTSCSTPIVAGIISLLNDYRIPQGRHPLGFLTWLSVPPGVWA